MKTVLFGIIMCTLVFESCMHFNKYILPTVQAMYAFCHKALADYVDSFETYANFKELV